MKRLTILLLFIATALQTYCLDILDVFRTMPESLTTQLEHIQKLELLDIYFQTHDSASVENKFHGITRIEELNTEQQLLILQNTPSSRIEVKILTINEIDTIIGFIFTACAPICDSHIEFFDKDWQKIDMEIPKLTLYDFLSPYKNFNSKDLYSLIDSCAVPDFICYRFSNENIIEAQCNAYSYLSVEQKEKIKPLLIKTPRKISVKKDENDFKIILIK